jgi:nucleoside-diphosphate-sugar epimerase
MDIFLTGGTGFLGGKILERLGGKHSFRALIRNHSAGNNLEKKGVQVYFGDLSDIQSNYLKDVDAVIHAAALAKPYGKAEDFQRINIDGTRKLIEVARSAGVKKFIHISTEAVCFQGKSLIDIDETAPVLQTPMYDYAYSKAVAEKLVLEANHKDFQTIALRPSWIWGPGDTNALPMMVEMVQSGKFMWVDKGSARKTTTYIYNLIDAIESTLDTSVSGKVYFINDGEYRTLKEFLTPLLATQGLSIPEKSVPGWLIRTVGMIAESIWKLTGRKGKPAGTRLEANFMSSEIVIKNDLAKKELNWKPRFTIEQGIEEIGRFSSKF